MMMAEASTGRDCLAGPIAARSLGRRVWECRVLDSWVDGFRLQGFGVSGRGGGGGGGDVGFGARVWGFGSLPRL